MHSIMGFSGKLGEHEGMSHWFSSGRIAALANWSFELSAHARSLWRLRREALLLARSEFFDRRWYLAHYPDVAAAGVDPVRHYLLHGAQEGRDPGPDFDTRFYLTQYRDVNESGTNPLVHFLRCGNAEGRRPIPPANRVMQREGDLDPIPLARSEARNKYESLWYATVSPEDLGLNFHVATALERMARNPEPPVILVPVHNAPAATDVCLRSLLLHSTNCRIVIIDDASTDRRVKGVLDLYASRGAVEVFRNAENLGYTRTINRGIILAGRSDVVLLNSDTQVTPGWLRNLRLAAYSRDNVGTATAFSNNAGAFSVPIAGRSNSVPAAIGLDAYARAISQLSLRSYPIVPTGNGFCMYVRRDCIDATGLLDEEAFPRGYGEENDFCMRAGKLGWAHVIDDATIIYHTRSASFGRAAGDLRRRGTAKVENRYPEYNEAVQAFHKSEELNVARERVRAVASTLDHNVQVRPRILFVLATKTGGTPQTNADLMAAINHVVEPLVLHCDSSTLSLMQFRDGAYVCHKRHVLRTPLRAFPHRSDEYDAVVAEWLVQFAIELVHIRHIALHGLGLVDVAKALGLPIVFSFHDFYTVCPSVHLLDEQNIYCAGRCTPTVGACRYALWGDRGLPLLKNVAIQDWKQQIGTMLSRCDTFVTTSDSAKRTITDAYPFLSGRPCSVIPHGRDVCSQETPPLNRSEINSSEIIRILVPGNLSPAKGDAVVAELAARAREHGLELHVMGALSPRLTPPTNFVYHGTYRRSEFTSKARAIAPHLGGIFSIWAETYCHTLTELWASGLPVIGFDFGAIGERIRRSGAGWLAPEPTAEAILDIIQSLRSHPADYTRKLAAVHAWQRTEGQTNNCTHMGEAYLALYSMHLPALTTSVNNNPRQAI